MSDFASKLMLLSILGFILPVFAGEGRRINVIGTALLRAYPDQADVYLSAEATQPTVKAALDRVQAAVRGAYAACAKYAADTADFTAGQVSVDKDFRWANNTQVFIGYRASQALTWRLRNLDRLGPLFEALSAGKLTRVSGVHYSHSALDSLERVAESRALANARLTAEALATVSGGMAGEALNIGNHAPADFSTGIQASDADGMATRAYGAASKFKPSFLVKPDQIEVRGLVFATYALLPAKPGTSPRP
jgi:uncharacterized protein